MPGTLALKLSRLSSLTHGLPLLHAFIFISLFCVGAANAQPPSKRTPILPSGNTTLEARSAGLDVQVVITTTEAKRALGREDPQFFVPRSWVDNIVITVNGKKVGVPLSAFLDVFDPREAEIHLKGKMGVLTLYGADAAMSYWSAIEFDSERVTRRRSGPSVAPGSVTQETTYTTVVVP